MAVREARKYPGGNGKVGVIGGSAGGSHDVYLAATGTKGDDGSMRPWRSLELTIYRQGVVRPATFLAHCQKNVGSSRPKDLRKASPIPYVDASVAPLYVVASDDESMLSQQFSDLIRKLKEVSATNFKQRLRTNSQQHAFSYCQR